MIMVHGDNKGLVLPPRVASIQVVIIPIYFANEEEKRALLIDAANSVFKTLKSQNVLVHLDDRDNYTPGNKYNHWEIRGVPIRLEIGPKDFEKQQCVVVRRDNGEKLVVPLTDVAFRIPQILEEIQNSMFARAKQNMQEYLFIFVIIYILVALVKLPLGLNLLLH